MKNPDTHEDLAVFVLAKWELEDELRAIEELLSESRLKNVSVKKKYIAGAEGVPPGDLKKKPKKK